MTWICLDGFFLPPPPPTPFLSFPACSTWGETKYWVFFLSEIKLLGFILSALKQIRAHGTVTLSFKSALLFPERCWDRVLIIACASYPNERNIYNMNCIPVLAMQGFGKYCNEIRLTPIDGKCFSFYGMCHRARIMPLIYMHRGPLSFSLHAFLSVWELLHISSSLLFSVIQNPTTISDFSVFKLGWAMGNVHWQQTARQYPEKLVRAG